MQRSISMGRLDLFVIQIKFKPKRGSRVARELETSQRRDRINTSLQRKSLKASAEHFRMQQRLQRALDSLIDVTKANSTVRQLPDRRVRRASLQHLWPFRDDSGQEMVLIGESRDAQTVFLCAFGDARPIHMRGDVRVANLLKR